MDRQALRRELILHVYGKTADLIRTESGNRDMSPDRLVHDIIWCWHVDLEKSKREQLQRAPKAETFDERIGDIE